jgi:hypothetical protein
MENPSHTEFTHAILRELLQVIVNNMCLPKKKWRQLCKL